MPGYVVDQGEVICLYVSGLALTIDFQLSFAFLVIAIVISALGETIAIMGVFELGKSLNQLPSGSCGGDC